MTFVVDNMSHIVILILETLFSFLKHILKAFGSENFCFTARLGFKRQFLSYSFCSLKFKLGLKSVIKKENNVTRRGGGSEKDQKSVTFYLTPNRVFVITEFVI